MKRRIGLLGLGTMGRPIAERLLNLGFDLMVFNRTVAKTEPLVRLGATRSPSPRELGETADVTITIVSDDNALMEVTTGPNGFYPVLAPGKIHIDMSTISPVCSQRLCDLCGERGAAFLHAPVLGSKPQAADGTLLIFVGGSEEAYTSCRDIFEAAGERIWRFPQVTRASTLKLICNQFIAGMIMTLCQGLVLGQKAGLDPDTVLEVLKSSALNAPMYQSKTRMILDRRFEEANFYVSHMLKDINLILAAGRELSVPLPALAAIREMYVAAEAAGCGQEDYSAIIKVLEELAHTQVSRVSAGL